MSSHDDFDAAIQRLKREANKLRDEQLHAMQDATYVGTTKEQAEHNDERRDQVTELVTKIVTFYCEEDPRTSTMSRMNMSAWNLSPSASGSAGSEDGLQAGG